MALRRILVIGATGKQGGATISALLAKPPSFDHEILALTRNVTSTSAIALTSKSNKITLLKGDLDNCDGIFANAGGKGTIWGVYSVQLPTMGKDSVKDASGREIDREIKQGCDLINSALKYGVEHFVYSSVDRGGEGVSDKVPTPVHHFATKYQIEEHLKQKCAGGAMTYTILRPVAFMDNLTPDLPGRAFAAMWAKMGDTKLQFVASKDIGIFAAQAFAKYSSDDYRNKSISLAGDELTQKTGDAIFRKVLDQPMPKSYGLVASLVQVLFSELRIMFKWFVDEGYGADVQRCRELNSQMMDFETWLKQESGFKR